MDYHHFLRSRRTIRNLKPDPIPDSVIKNILTTAAYAPSAHDQQPWRFCVVTESRIKARLGEAITSQMKVDLQIKGASETDIEKRIIQSIRRMDEAPVTILLCRDTTAVHTDAPEEVIMGIQSTALAGLQLLLAAHAEGLGGNWVCWPLYARQATRLTLGLPETWEPQAMFFLGWPNESPETKVLKPLDQIMYRF
jgi:coenzyme F420-0:L-glutamate ligase/coenzyme F420-1:gamma-L-glutamate ligase